MKRESFLHSLGASALWRGLDRAAGLAKHVLIAAAIGLSAQLDVFYMAVAILGVLALLLVNELRKMFGTVLAENCFVPENVASLRRMGDLSFFIAAMSAVRCVVYLTIAMLVIILVFIIAGMFSKVLAMVFEEAVRYKKENDLTI